MTIQSLLANIDATESGPHIAALFDFDGTIIAGYSATVFLRDALAQGELRGEELVELTRALSGFGLGTMGFSALMAVHAQYLAGKEEKAYAANAERLFRKRIARLIYPETRRLIEAHRAKGHTIAIISSATPYQVLPAAQDLDIEHVYATELDVKKGIFTGGVKRPTCFGKGKVTAAKKLAKKTGADLGASFFYTDSTDDIQLLEHVGRPVTLNPKKKLKRVSSDNAWPTATFDSRGKISVNRFLRSAAATGSLVSSIAAALPVYALTGSKRDSLNFSTSLFADTCSALIGLDLEINGQENLWSHRPAVFMFNHQSKADVPIMASLIRRDVVGVGKKEIKNMPLIGPAMGLAGIVFVDRSNREKAIESMKPLVAAMRDEKKSLVIAPEGTRTPSRKLAQFKKGGFHIALQVGVPIVPVVIHNAGDIAPKGDFAFKPGKVRVDVLPAVDTSSWTLGRMDEQVNEVRNLFLKTLGQPQQSVEEVARLRESLPDDMRPELQSKRRKGQAPNTTPTKKTAAGTPVRKKATTKTAPKAQAPKTAPKSAAKRKPGGTAKAKVATTGAKSRAAAAANKPAAKKAAKKSQPAKKRLG
jgi:putative phosphoserine phosphatase/1-acylglycerol-3-phosphate O-acyltransferase